MAEPSMLPVPPVTPHLVVDDARAAIEFYKKAFGAEEVVRQATPDGKKIVHASLRIAGGLVMLNDDFPEMGGSPRTPKALGGSPVTIHLQVPDVDALWKRVLAAGATVTMPLADMFWGDRYGKVRDPFGHEWSMATFQRQTTEAEHREALEKLFGAKK